MTAVEDSRKDLHGLNMDRKIKFEENSPHQEGIISETYDKMFIQEQPELKDLRHFQINTEIPAQANRHR